MRIVYVAPFGMRHKTTVWARTLPLAQQLTALGWQATILVPPWDSPEDGGLRENRAGVEVVQVNIEGGLPAMTARLLREIGMRQPEIVHCVKPRAYAGIVQWLMWQRRKMGARTADGGRALPISARILLDMDDWEQAWQAVNQYNPVTARFLAWQEEWGMRHADGITTASRWLEAHVRDHAPGVPLLYLPNGVAMDARGQPSGTTAQTESAVSRESTQNVLLFTRFVETTPAWLADFAQALLAERSNVRLVIAGSPIHAEGDAAFRSAVAERASTYAGRIHWLGYVPQAALPGLYAASTVAVFPAQATILQQAKCSVRLATTLLNNVPVVASAVGEQAHYGADGTAWLVPADASAQTFASNVIALLADAPACARMIETAYAHLQASYQWSTLAQSLDGFYRRILG